MVFSPEATSKHRPAGFSFSATATGMKADGSPDLAWLQAAGTAAAAARFARDSVPVPAVELSRRHLERSGGRVQGVLVHAGIANVDAPGGENRARRLIASTARHLSVPDDSLLLCGTGERGKPLPDDLESAVPDLLGSAASDRAEEFSAAIGTGDRTVKTASAEGIVDGRRTRILGIAKGSRNVHPRFCTLLAFLLTDAPIDPGLLADLLRASAGPILDGVRVDGRTSPADTLLGLASGRNGGPVLAAHGPGVRTLQAGLAAVSQVLARRIVEDGSHPDSVLRRWQVSVSSARTSEQAAMVADEVILDVTVLGDLAGDRPAPATLLQVLAGRHDVDAERLSVMVDGRLLLQRGRPAPDDDRAPVRSRRRSQASLRIDLGQGREHVTRWASARAGQERDDRGEH